MNSFFIKTLYKTLMLLFAVSLFFTTNIQAKTSEPLPSVITKSFFLDCEKRSIEDPYQSFRAEIDKEGNPRCRGYRKTAKPHCPEGYAVIKRKCVKLVLKKLKTN